MVSHVGSTYVWVPLICDENGTFPLWSSASKPQNPIWSWEKHQTKPIGEHFPKYPTSTPQNCQGYQKQGKSEQQSQPREACGDMMTKRNVDPGGGVGKVSKN